MVNKKHVSKLLRALILEELANGSDIVAFRLQGFKLCFDEDLNTDIEDFRYFDILGDIAKVIADSYSGIGKGSDDRFDCKYNNCKYNDEGKCPYRYQFNDVERCEVRKELSKLWELVK